MKIGISLKFQSANSFNKKKSAIFTLKKISFIANKLAVDTEHRRRRQRRRRNCSPPKMEVLDKNPLVGNHRAVEPLDYLDHTKGQKRSPLLVDNVAMQNMSVRP